MATGTELNNLAVCGTQGKVGFNTQKGCPYVFENTKELWVTSSDFEFDNTENFNTDYINTLRLAGKISILKDITDFPETGTDPQIETLPDNTEISAGEARYKYSPVFLSDLYFNKLLGSLEGQGNNRFIFIDSTGNMLLTEGSGASTSRGFLASRTSRGKYTLQSPGVGAKATLDFQLANTAELLNRPVYRGVESMSFNPRDIEAIVQSVLSFDAIPSDLETTIAIRVKQARGQSSFVTGLTNVTDWSVFVGQSENVVTAVSELNNVYTLTLTSALGVNDSLTVALNGVVEVAGDALYRSYLLSETVLA